MLRLIHNQTVYGAILVDDIDDGLPNKQVHRLGSTADQKAYKRDGYANEPKQSCYISRTKASDASIAGYIDLNETQRVLFSAGQGKIRKLAQAGLIDAIQFVASDLDTPVITNAQADTPSDGDVTLTGTGFASLNPNTSTVIITGDGEVTLTQAEIIDAGGSITATEIVIPASLFTDTVAATGSITVIAGSDLVDGETFTLDDGVNNPVVFEFNSSGGVTGSNVAVTFTGGSTATQVRDAIISAINGVASGLAITASPGGSAVVSLVNDAEGMAGNIAITDTVADASFTHTGMSGGGGALATSTSAQVEANDQLSNVFALV